MLEHSTTEATRHSSERSSMTRMQAAPTKRGLNEVQAQRRGIDRTPCLHRARRDACRHGLHSPHGDNFAGARDSITGSIVPCDRLDVSSPQRSP